MQTIEYNTAILTLVIGGMGLWIPFIIEFLRIRESKRKELIEVKKNIYEIYLKLIELIYNCSKTVDPLRSDVRSVSSEKEIVEDFDLFKFIDEFSNLRIKFFEFKGIFNIYSKLKKIDLTELTDSEQKINNYLKKLWLLSINKEVNYEKFFELDDEINIIKKLIEDSFPSLIIKLK